MATDALGLYVHIPICLHKCDYCDFCSFAGLSPEVRRAYIDALCAEISSYAKESPLTLSTVFFGGGTPSLLTPTEAERIMETIRRTFRMASDAEITFECNPKTVTEEKARAFYSLGFNRVSIGLQSIHKNELKNLGRIHDYSDFLDSLSILRNVGFSEINVDLMYAIPGQTTSSFAETLDAVIALSPSHVSAYSLIVEDGTPFGDRRETLDLPDEETEAALTDLLCEKMRAAGYLHYEISNFAKPAHECRHNLIYWRDGAYIGVGVAAYSYYEGRRFGNTRNLSDYLSDRTAHLDLTPVTPEDERFEYAMLRLRLSEGFSLSEYEERFGVSFTEGKTDLLSRYRDLGLLNLSDGRVRLTERGFIVSNEILAQIL